MESFGIVLTEQWTSLPLEPEAHRAFRTAALTRLRDRENWKKSDERKLELMLERARRDLLRGRARFAALFADESTKAMHDGATEILLASVTFSVHTRRDLDTEMELSPAVLFSAFASETRERNEVRHSNVEKPRFTDLECGRAVHLRRLYESDTMLPRFDPYFAESFIVSLDDAGSACGVVQFTTTSLRHAREFSRTFVRLANTITLLTETDPTHFNATTVSVD